MKHLIGMMVFWVMMTPYEYVNGQYTKLVDGRNFYFNLDNASYIIEGRNYNDGSEVFKLMIGTESLLFVEKKDSAIIRDYLNNN